MMLLNFHFTFIGTNFTLRRINIYSFRELSYTHQIDFTVNSEMKTYLLELYNYINYCIMLHYKIRSISP